MKTGRASRTAMKVAWLTAALGEHETYAHRLPARAAALTKRLLRSANLPLYRESLMPLASNFMLRRLGGRRTAVIYEGFVSRRAFMNRQVLAAIEAGATQVLVVGAGLDTLCVRLAPEHKGLGFYEVDHPATSAVKIEGVDQIGRPPNMHLLAADLSRTKLSRVMGTAKRWQPDATSIVVCEGLLMYLTADQTRDLFEQIAACTGPRSRVAFSHLLDLDGQGPVTLAALRMLGEPWLSSTTRGEIPRLAKQWGFRVLEQDASRGPGDLEGLAVIERVG